MRQSNRGFTLIELMIVVAIVGILASVALPMFQQYSVRAQVAEGMKLVGPLKAAVTEYYNENGDFPADNAEAGVAAAATYSGQFVERITVDGDEIDVRFGGSAHADINGLEITLTAQPSGGSMAWTCAGGAGLADIYLPNSCS